VTGCRSRNNGLDAHHVCHPATAILGWRSCVGALRSRRKPTAPCGRPEVVTADCLQAAVRSPVDRSRLHTRPSTSSARTLAGGKVAMDDQGGVKYHFWRGAPRHRLGEAVLPPALDKLASAALEGRNHSAATDLDCHASSGASSNRVTSGESHPWQPPQQLGCRRPE
jgi:hypothetical protein